MTIEVDPTEIEWSAIRAQGPGGQNVNKASNGLQLRFDIRTSSLPHAVKERLLTQSDQRITRDDIAIQKRIFFYHGCPGSSPSESLERFDGLQLHFPQDRRDYSGLKLAGILVCLEGKNISKRN